MTDSQVIRFQAPEFPPLDKVAAYFEESIQARWFSNNGPCVERLERRCADYLGLTHPGVSVSNATAGLLVAMRACFGEPDAARRLIAVPSFTFAATVHSAVWAGFEPLFLDMDAHDWHPSQDSLERLVDYREGLAGVLWCSTFGCAPSEERRRRMRETIEPLNVPVVVDSAAGFGAVDVDGRALGDQGDVEVFSFHATKPFAVGEGGLVTSDDPDLLHKVRRLANFGFDEAHAVPGPVGINAKMSELTAAAGLAVLDGYDDVLARRRSRAHWLLEEIGSLGVGIQEGSEGAAFQFVPVLMPDPRSRQRLLEIADESKVEVRTYFDPPMHRLSQYARFPAVAPLKVTEDVAPRMVALPMANDLGDSSLEHIRDLVHRALLNVR